MTLAYTLPSIVSIDAWRGARSSRSIFLMPDVHVPKLDDDDENSEETNAEGAGGAVLSDVKAPVAARPRRTHIGKIVLEVLLISAGVFLGLAGEQWRQSAEHRELARESLRRFRSEIETNRKAVADVKDYHVTMRQKIGAYLAADANARKTLSVAMQGVRPVTFEHTAWDLAIATQSLTYIDRNLAFNLSRVYSVQDDYAVLSRAVLQAMYLRPPSQDLDGFFHAVALYYDDVVLSEPRLMTMYDEMLPQIDRALGE
jgi:hypothetical protein